jgi:GNAT superfamily N-acetyltransferase
MSSDVKIRAYRDEDDAACKELEMRAMQGGRFPRLQAALRFFIRVGFEHYSTFDAKPKQYEDCIILVAEETQIGEIVGVVCAAIKTCFAHGKTQKVGYVFDLRVHEEYQGRKIGSQLSKAIEQACIEKECTMLYLSVNKNNVKACSLYRKHGWTHASPRSPSIDILLKPVVVQETALKQTVSSILTTLEKLPVPKAIEMTTAGHATADMTLSNMGQLFTSPLYEGTFVARRGESYAGISLWDGSSLNGIKVERIVLPISYYQALANSAVAGLVAKAVAAWGASYWLFALYGTFQAASNEVVEYLAAN